MDSLVQAASQIFHHKALNPISMSLDPTTTHSFVAALHISMSLNPTTTHSFMAALHISTVVFQRLFQSCFKHNRVHEITGMNI